MENENEITLKEKDIWDFVFREVCNNQEILNTKDRFVMSPLYSGFRRRVNYFLKTKRDEKRGKNESK